MNRKRLRHLVDLVWQHIWEDQSVPSTTVADELIDRALLVEISENKELVDGKLYWVRHVDSGDEWHIGRYNEKFQQFQFIGRTIYDMPTIVEIDYNIVEKL